LVESGRDQRGERRVFVIEARSSESGSVNSFGKRGVEIAGTWLNGWEPWSTKGLEQTALAQVKLQENVLDGAKDKLDLLGIRSASVMRIDLLGGGRLVQGNKAMQEIVAGRIIVVASAIIGEVITEG